jgi:hypothetical protein
MDSLNSICMVPAACNQDTADRYAVDFKVVEAYLTALNRGGFFSPAYRSSQRAGYRRWQDSLRVHSQYDGPPRGFDYDPIILSQDSDDLALLLKTPPRSLRYSADSAKVSFRQMYPGLDGEEPGREVLFSLSRHGQRWLIDAIGLQ